MYHEDFLTFVQVGQIHMNLTVKTSSTEQGSIQNVSTVGGCHDDDTAVSAKSIHLRQELVEGAFTFVVTTHCCSLATSTTDGINLVDEDDARRFCLCLLEEVAHTAGTHTHEHFHKLRTRQGEERHTSLACYSFGKQRLTCSRRTYKKSSLRDLTTQIGVFLRCFQEIDNLLHLLLGTCLSCHILKGYLW